MCTENRRAAFLKRVPREDASEPSFSLLRQCMILRTCLLNPFVFHSKLLMQYLHSTLTSSHIWGHEEVQNRLRREVSRAYANEEIDLQVFGLRCMTNKNKSSGGSSHSACGKNRFGNREML